MGAVIAVIATVIVAAIITSPSCPSVDRTPPIATYCPSANYTAADPLSMSTIVRWREPTASDPSRPVSVQRVDQGPHNGNYFHASQSPYNIKYSATDGRGNRNHNLCPSFKVHVSVIRCRTHSPVSMGSLSCSSGNLYGSECYITCMSGYSRSGASRRICQSNSTWSGSTPRCTPIQCSALPGTSCTNSNYYNSICTHTCDQPGYSIAPGQSATRVCRANGQWTGMNPTCVDTRRPTLDCPDTIRAYADRSQTYATITWDVPQVDDNSNRDITPVQTAGLPSGSMFSRGSHIVTYEARDEAGNTGTCSFSIIVQVIQCPTRPFQPGQRVTCSSQSVYGSICHVECSPGYVLIGAVSIECQQQGDTADGVWSAEQPTCQGITCPPLTPPVNGGFHGNTPCPNAYGSWCRFECNDGYELTGSGIRRCLAASGAIEGFWDGFEAQCEVQSCPRAYISNYAFITNQTECPATDQVPAETMCHYACRPGHVLTGSAEVTCGQDGDWDSPFPYCEALTCDSSELPPPDNGIKNGCPHAEEIFGTMCTLSCNLGFMPTQPTYVTCTDDGNGVGSWDGNTITCEEVRCDPLIIPDSPGYMPMTCTLHGVDVDETDQMQSYATVCVASCDLGFTSSGSGSRTCLLTGQWDGTPLQCNDITPPTLICPPDITLFAGQGTSFAVVGYDWEPIQVLDASGGLLATLSSINGQPVPANRSSIFQEGTYRLIYFAQDSSGNSATCDVMVDVIVARCPPLYGPQYSETSLVSGQGDCDNSVVYGSACSISCEDGYTLSTGTDTVIAVCTKTTSFSTIGYWQSPAVDCTANTCRVPAIPNGYISGCIGLEVDYQSSCTFVCNPGFRNNQTSLSRTTRTCLADGNWTGKDPSCEAVVCPGFQSLDQGTVQPSECSTDSELPYNTRCTFTCNDGYSLNGPFSKVCTAEGVWSDTRPVSCTDHQPPVFTDSCPVYVSRIAPSNMRQAVVTFQTPEATDNSNDVTVRSQDPSLGSGSSFTEGTTHLIYVATDATMNSRRCDVYVTVQVLRCQPLQAPASGSLAQCPSNIYGSTCSFMCNAGYNLMGPYSRTCEKIINNVIGDGNQFSNENRVEWSGQNPTCQPITCPALTNRPPAIRSSCFQYPPATELLGTTCNWYCPYGYGGVGTPQSICQANSTWDVVDFTCEERSCPALVPADGMDISPANCLTSPTFNNNCFLRCAQSGYRVDPPSYGFIRCLGNGDWSLDSTAFTCIDYESPHFNSCPLDFITYTPESSTEASVTWDIGASDNSGDIPSIQCNIQRPAVLPVGEHSVTCTATDSAGNQAMCSFEVQVKVRRCRQLSPPFYGVFIGSCDNSYGCTCQVGCQSGYTLQGSDTAICSRNATTGMMYWARNGPRPSCQIASCPPLPADLIPASGGVYPSFCSGPVQPYYGTTCHFFCRNGFDLIGPIDHRILTCLADGSWDQNLFTLDVRCRDLIPPTLRVCPGSLSGSMSGQTLGVVLAFDVPMALDNSGIDLTVVKTPSDIDSPYNFTQDTHVSYNFTDAAGNSVECSFSVNIQDNLSPVLVSCPEDQAVTTDLIQTTITWSEPEFRELTGDDLDVSCSHQSASLFPWGSSNIQCSATNLDNGKTTICQFTVTITPTECPHLDPPRNGATACDSWAYGRYCSMFCNDQYDVREFTPTFLACGLSGTWAPLPGHFPDCVRTFRQGQMRIFSELHYFSGVCSSAVTQNQIKEQFILLLNQSIFSEVCTLNAEECHVDNVDVTCGPAAGRRKRRAISNWKDSSAHDFGYGFDQTLQLNASFLGVSTDEFTEHAQMWFTEMREKGKLPSNRRDEHRRRFHASKLPNPNRERVRSRRSVNMPNTFSISFSLMYNLPNDPNMTDFEFEDAAWLGYDMLYQLVDAVEAKASGDGIQLPVPGLEMDPHPVLYYATPEPACPFGFVPTFSLECGGCAMGQCFNNNTLSCEECPIGQYQDHEAQFVCKMCPPGMSTIKAGSTNATDCLGICPSGHFSSTRLQSCSKCEKGVYQSETGSVSCDSCPLGQSTVGIGSTSMEACTDVCPAGSFSVSGVQPCISCPLHSYQPVHGQSSCHPCPAGQVTQLNGATNSNMCIIQTFCTATSCLNDGTCVEQMNTYHCGCPVGLTGRHCETDLNDCQQDSCFNGATCLDERNGFSCVCADGYEGDDCSIPINYCIDDPCENGGICNSQTNGFTCTCDDGFTGTTCGEDINECQSQSQPCQHGGSCINGVGDYLCICSAGFTGDTCEIDIIECKSNPCQHNGTCIDGINSYQCDCVAGYSGANCEIDDDLCASSPCSDGATCQDLDDRYQCACPCGRSGVHCELVMQPCDYQPCKNDGVCTETPTEAIGYRCECTLGFTGPDCKTNVNECSSEPCSNGGTCSDGVNSFQCICADGFEGPRCEGRTDLCTPNPCHHNAPCEDEGDDYYCTCPAGLSGRDCEIQVDVCYEGQTCLNGGACAPPSMGQLCRCVHGFVGEYCEINFNDCASQPCTNGAICLDGINSFTCQCLEGFTGTLCDDQVFECVSSPCQNGGTCIDKTNGYQCDCASGFNGINCENNKNDCFPGACDKGQCVDGIDSYKCICDDGFTGRRCDIDVNECQSYPCANGATCRDMVAHFICDCADGWIGDQCEINEDDCASNPCMNSGDCIDGQHSYTCHCKAGFTGSDCQVNINECQSNPCHSQSTCIDGINSFTCACNHGLKGVQCQINVGFCQPNPCRHGGSCTPTPAGFVCQCQTGFVGILCQTNVDDCAGHQCQNGASCVDQANRYSCRCAPGFTGQLCETALDICSAEPCQNNAQCLPTGNRAHHCTCQQGFTGVRCEIAIDNCKPSPCLHGSTCISGLNTHSCICPPGYTGTECEQDINECTSHLCQNDAQCIDGINQYQCKCKPGFVGIFCDEHAPCNFDMVFRSNRSNQFVSLHQAVDEPLRAFTLTLWIRTATANSDILSYTTQYTGPGQTLHNAEFAISKPEALEVFIQGYQFSSAVSVNDNHWHHLAISWDEHGGSLSIYQDGHLLQARQQIRPGATINGGGLFILGELRRANHSQSERLTGSVSNVNLWDTALDSLIIQQYAQTCGCAIPGNIIAGADFMDKATLGQITIQTPSLCDVVDDCASNPCQEGSTCIDDVNQYICQCPLGFTGPYCEINIDDCGTDTTPCDNGGICVDGVSSFTCQCPQGFSGQACELRKGDGGWSDWSDWDDCSQSCEGGSQSRHRSCTNPRPTYGGSPCEGSVTETRQCNTGSCPTCKHVYSPVSGNLDCDNDGEEQNCTISCQKGYAFSRSILPYYHCGPSTNYQWSHETDDNPGVIFPKCTEYKPPSKFGMNMNLVYRSDLICDGINATRDSLAFQEVSKAVTSNLKNVKCLEENTCALKRVQVSGCSPPSPGDHARRRRRRRSVESIHVSIKLERNVNIPDQQNLTNEQVTNNNQTDTVAAASELRDGALYLINQSASGQFAVTIDGVVYDIDSEQTESFGLPICHPGMVRVATEDARCVPCEAGWFNDQEDCRPCPHGMYRSQDGSTYCQSCPRGLSTIGNGAREESDCITIVP